VDAGAKNDSVLASATAPKTGATTATATTIAIPKPIGKRLEIPAPINSLAFSPDGKLLAVGTYQRVLLCDPATRIVLKVWSGHLDTVRSLAFSPDGKLLVAGGGVSGALGQVRLWGVNEAKELRTFGDHTDIVNGVAFSPDSKTVATASGDRSVKLWDAATGKLQQALRDHADAVLSVAYRADGKLLASCGVDKSVKIWDSASGKRLYSLGASEEAVTDLCFIATGQVVSASTDRLAKLWNIGPEGGGHVRNFGGHGNGIYSVSASSDGQLLATASGDKTLRLWNIASGGHTATFTEAKDWLYAVRISPDKKRLAAGSWDGTLYLWSLDPNKLEGTLSTVFPSTPQPPSPNNKPATRVGEGGEKSGK
jgi:WD40 repeat protein